MKLAVPPFLLTCLCSAAVAPSATDAQTYAVSGTISDPADGAVAGVVVSVNGVVRSSSDSVGAFRLLDVEYGTNVVAMRRIGYESIEFDIWVDSTMGTLAVTLDPVPVRLEDLSVATEAVRAGKMREFDIRRQEGEGHFLTREEIAERAPRLFSDVLRRVPGLRVLPNPFGFGNTVSSIRGTGFGGCAPLVFLDGVMLESTNEIDRLVKWEVVEGVEVYNGPASIPARFNVTNSVCAVIAIWTK